MLTHLALASVAGLKWGKGGGSVGGWIVGRRRIRLGLMTRFRVR